MKLLKLVPDNTNIQFLKWRNIAMAISFAMIVGSSVLVAARGKAIAAGLDPIIYSHPIGYHGHAAGTPIGMWDNQAARPEGEAPMDAPTAWSIRATFSSSSASAELLRSISSSRASLAPLNASNAAIISCMAARASGVPEAVLVSFMVSPATISLSRRERA